MADYIPAIDTVRVSLDFLYHGHAVENILHVTFPVDPDAADLDSLGAAIVGWWTVTMSPHMSSFITLESVSMRVLTVVDGEIEVYTTGLPVAGGTDSGTMANNVALVSTWRTRFAGRSNRGRTYWAGVPISAFLTNNLVTDAYAAAIQSACNVLISDILTGSGGRLVVASFRSGGAPRTIAQTVDIVNNTTNSKVDSQRRRLKNAT